MTLKTYRLQFFVAGKPAPQGSKKHIGHGILIESSKQLPDWRNAIAYTALDGMKHLDVAIFENVALTARFEFIMPRPLSTPQRTTPAATKRPDLDKLVRAVFDALTHVVYHDDSQIVCVTASKRIAERSERPGVHIDIATMP